MNPIYKPSGKAAEYGELAINIYTGCNHGCIYCFAPLILKRDRKTFHSVVEPRNGIVEAVKRQLDKEQFTGKLLHFCFCCDPYPADIDTTPTREIIKAIKDSKNHVQILTKGGFRAERDFDLLDENDWFGATITGAGSNYKTLDIEPNAPKNSTRYETLKIAKNKGVQTWVSCEPVLNPMEIYELIKGSKITDLFRIGKLNYAGLDPRLKEIHDGINWFNFGHECERICRENGRNYYIKESLRKIMEGEKS